MQKLILTGQTFGYLTVYSEAESKGYWVCHCKCGKETTVKGASLRNGNTKSCGCMRRERRKAVLPARYRKPKPFIDVGTFADMNQKFIIEFIEAFAPYGVEFLKNLMYRTHHNKKAYGPFNNIFEMIGHATQHAIGEPDHENLYALEAWRKKQKEQAE